MVPRNCFRKRLIISLGVMFSVSPTTQAVDATAPTVELAVQGRTSKPKTAPHVTVTIRNETSRPVWVPKPIMALHGTGGIEVEIRDVRGNLMKSLVTIGDSFGMQIRPSDTQLRDTHVLLAPGDFIGFDRSLDDLGFKPLIPGSYSVRALFHADSCKAATLLEKGPYSGKFKVACGDFPSPSAPLAVGTPAR
jgi:hypothetical protein